MIRILKQREGRKAIRPLLFLLVFVISAISSVYAVQELISLQGKVTTSAGALVNDGNLTVLVYDAPTGGNLVYNSSEDFNTSIQAGSFDVLLGSVTDMHLKLSDVYYMDLEVNGEDIDWDGEERKQFQSGVGREVSGNFSVDLSDSTFFVDDANNRIGVGTSTPGATLEVTNSTAATLLLNVSHGTDLLIINSTGIDLGSGLLYVDPLTNKVGIGTATPATSLQVWGDGTYSASFMNGNVGIGTSSPGDALLNVTGTIDAWQITINGTAVGTSSGWTDDGTIVRLSTSTDSVGIGTAEPGDALLNVTGTIDAWGMTINGTTIGTDYAPIGTILPYASNLTAPNGYLLCDGSNVSRTTYADLFAVIGTSYGDGDGSTTFTLPDLRGRVPVGEDLSAERLANGTDALGFAGGEETHVLTVAELAPHNHPVTNYGDADSGAGPLIALQKSGTTINPFLTDTKGSGTAHNNLQPYQVVSYIIKYGHTGTESPGTWNFTGTNLYTSRTDYNVGIGTSAPGDALLNVTGTIDAWQVTINGTAIGSGIGSVVVQTFTSSGTYTPTAGTVYAVVYATAAGGAGGAGGSGGASASGGAGGAGETRLGAFLASTIGASQTVTIGGAGADSSFGALLVAKPGAVGGNAATTVAGNGGIGGTGGSGGVGFSGGSGTSGGMGGAVNQFGVAGAASFWGGGGKGGEQGAVGQAGVAYGSGGGSGGGYTGSAGGAGAGGVVVVYDYVSTGNIGTGVIGTGAQGNIPFYNSAGTTLTATSVLTLSQSGNVGIGTTSPTDKLSLYTDSTAQVQLNISNTAGSGHIKEQGATFLMQQDTGGSYLISGGTVWNENSDQRLKTNINTLTATNGLDAILKLRPVSFNWKDVNQNKSQGTRLGFIAQEVEQIFPQFISTGPVTTITLADGSTQTIADPKGFGYSDFIVPLVKAVQEQQTQIEDLQSENDLLKSELCKKDSTYSWCTSKITAVHPVQETPPVESPVTSPLETPIVNSVPVVESFSPVGDVVLSVGDSQEFTVATSDADAGDVLSLQWYVNNLAVSEQVSDSYTFAASEAGAFEVKVLVTDGKDYSTHKWSVTVNEAGRSFEITGAAVGVAKQGSSLLDWLRSLF